MTRFQLQGQGENNQGDWSTEYVASSDADATFNTYEDAQEEMIRLIGEYSNGETQVTEDVFRIVEVD